MVILYLKIQCGISRIWCYQIYLVIPMTRRFPDVVAVDSYILSQANNAVVSSAFYGTTVFVLVVDGTFIAERSTVTLNQQVVSGVSL